MGAPQTQPGMQNAYKQNKPQHRHIVPRCQNWKRNQSSKTCVCGATTKHTTHPDKRSRAVAEAVQLRKQHGTCQLQPGRYKPTATAGQKGAHLSGMRGRLVGSKQGKKPAGCTHMWTCKRIEEMKRPAGRNTTATAWQPTADRLYCNAATALCRPHPAYMACSSQKVPAGSSSSKQYKHQAGAHNYLTSLYITCVPHPCLPHTTNTLPAACCNSVQSDTVSTPSVQHNCQHTLGNCQQL
jgi:hypothetical protein